MGRREAPAPARAAPLLSRPVRAVHRAVRRQRRRFLRPARGRPLRRPDGAPGRREPRFDRLRPPGFEGSIGPFLGRAAVFFDLHAAGRFDGPTVRLADVNPDLIGCYRAVRDDPEAVITALAPLEREHRERGDACYYDVRDRRFNPMRASLGAPGAAAYTPALAAMLIYLNRTGYNGLFRLNRQGAFNVPVGRYSNPRICDAEHVRTVARALAAPGVSLDLAPFEETLGAAGPGDFVYCDPPYAPLSR